MTKSTVRVDVSQLQHTAAGRLVGDMFYRGFLEKVLNRTEYSGYPHNGGSHSLYLMMDLSDLEAFLDSIQETFTNHEGTPKFVEFVKTMVRQRYPHLTLH